MMEMLIAKSPAELLYRSGAVFYSGWLAWSMSISTICGTALAFVGAPRLSMRRRSPPRLSVLKSPFLELPPHSLVVVSGIS